jgi:ABC-type dipeptide/oligopeptide/nickel transport system permease component
LGELGRGAGASIVSYITQALPAFVLALICGYVAIAFASSPPDVSKWGVSRELWPKIYNAFVLQGVALLLAAYAGMRA